MGRIATKDWVYNHFSNVGSSWSGNKLCPRYMDFPFSGVRAVGSYGTHQLVQESDLTNGIVFGINEVKLTGDSLTLSIATKTSSSGSYQVKYTKTINKSELRMDSDYTYYGSVEIDLSTLTVTQYVSIIVSGLATPQSGKYYYKYSYSASEYKWTEALTLTGGSVELEGMSGRGVITAVKNYGYLEITSLNS